MESLDVRDGAMRASIRREHCVAITATRARQFARSGAMANFTWKNAAGGDWSDAANWSLGGIIVAPRPPESATDTAFFDNLANPLHSDRQGRHDRRRQRYRRPLHRNRSPLSSTGSRRFPSVAR